MKNHLFVYGTLLNQVESDIAQFLKKESQFLGEGHLQGYLYDLGQYPGVVPCSECTDMVYGHVFQLKRIRYSLPILDRYEAIGESFGQYNEYRRELVPILFQNAKLDCWVYVYNLSTEGLSRIMSGNYLDVLNTNKKHQEFIKRV